MILFGDCLNILNSIEENSIQLIMTSPPYADARKHQYGGIKPEDYTNWFLPRAEQFLKVLKPSGTFILNIKEKVIDGERSTYVIDLIKSLREQGWRWTEEFIWHKNCSFPGKWRTRFRDGWERILQFNKDKYFDMYQNEVKVPASEATIKRIKRLTENDKKMHVSQTGSKMSYKLTNWIGRDTVYPTNVLYLAAETSNKHHPATFPISIPTWFIKLFSKEGDVVLDPFCGSGTTCLAAKKLNRQYIGIDIKQEYVKLAEKRCQEG